MTSTAFVRAILLAVALISVGILSACSPAQMQTAPPLVPEMNCAASQCDIIFTGVFDGQKLTSEPLPLRFKGEDLSKPTARAMSEEALKANGITAPFGWRIGGEEHQEMEVYLTALRAANKASPENSVFMIEQRFGSELIGYGYKFLTLSYSGDKLVTARDIQTLAGPQKRVEAASTENVRVKAYNYNPDTGDLDAVFIDYKWYDGPEGRLLGSPEEIEDITSQENTPLTENSEAETANIKAPELTAQEALMRTAFTMGNGAEKAFYESLGWSETDARFAPLLDACGVAPDNVRPDYELFSASYSDRETYDPQNAFNVFVASQDERGDIYAEGYSYPIETLDIKAVGQSAIQLASTAEDVSGVTRAYDSDGYEHETHGFEELKVDVTFYCANPAAGARFVKDFAASKLANARPEPQEAHPIRYSVTFPASDTNAEGMCEYMYDEAKERIQTDFISAGFDPILQIAEAPNNDVRITLPEFANDHDMAMNDCRFDMNIDAYWTEENLTPLPARNQNYESGYELIHDGVQNIVSSYLKNIASQTPE